MFRAFAVYRQGGEKTPIKPFSLIGVNLSAGDQRCEMFRRCVRRQDSDAARDTISDKFIMTYKAGEPKPTIGEAAVPHAPVETYEQLEGEAQ